MPTTRRAAAAAASLALAIAAAAPVDAQYFGRNKVRYESRDFRVLKTEHFDVHFDDSAEPAARLAARMAERWYARLRVLLEHDLSSRQPIILYAGHPDFEQTNAIDGALQEATGGVTDAQKRRVILPAAGPLPETDHVLGHELVHAFQFDVMGGGNRAALRMPLWFIEGMAEYLSLGPFDTHTAMWMRDAVRTGRLPAVRDLGHPRYFPYRYGHAFWAYVGGRWGDRMVTRALKSAARSRRDPVRVLERLLGVSEAQLSQDWHASLREAYAADARGGDVSALGRELAAGRAKAVLNIAPALSPDGRRVVFLSEREGGSIELFLADTETGRVLRRILSRRLDPHFDSLQFVGSAGAWAADGRRFAFAAVRRGRAVVSILDVERGAIEREIALPTLEEVLNPTWSPDGRRLAFSAIRGGLADLYTYDLASDRLDALTDDGFADLQPAWSPDGASIAFVTDRFGTRLDDLHWGRYRLARFVVATQEIEPLPSFDDAKNVNPQWSQGALYFLSDRSGVSNVYRLDPATGAIRQVTDVAVGLSGLTELSPALAAAASAGRLVVTAFARGRYRLYSIEEPRVLDGREMEVSVVAAAPLPPRERTGALVQELLDDAGRGLPAPETATAVKEQPYAPRLTADGLASPYLSVGSDRFGLSVMGGGSFFWSDLLGNQQLGAAAQMSGGPKDISGILAYQNRSHRWNWGLAAQQRTWRSGSYSSGLSELDGRAVALEELVRFREIDRGATARIAYPFDRSRRLELSGGYHRVSFSVESDTSAFSLETGQRISRQKSGLTPPAPLNLGELGAAYVIDTARFGATSPVEGERLRVELTPTLGTKAYAGVRLDYRRYLRPMRPLTLATRVLHVGRYGRDADDPRLTPLFAGYAHLVRGYDGLGSPRCLTGACSRLDGLTGSKLIVTNAELRLPAFFFASRERPYGPLPAELALFFDAGRAWTNGPSPEGSRDWIRSWGAALRVNVFGFAVCELDYIRPLDLPGQRSMLRFRLGTGF